MSRNIKGINKRRIILMGVIFFSAAIVTGAVTLTAGYKYRFSSAVTKDYNLKVYPDDTFEIVSAELEKQGVIKSAKTMQRYIKRHKFGQVIRGNYDLKAGTSYRTVLSTLANGRETPIRLTFNSFRMIDRLIGAVAKRTLVDSASLMAVMNNDSLLQSRGFTRATVISMFIPNTYEIYWSTTAEEFFERMYREYDTFWSSNKRRQKAEKMGFTPIEISIIASIVDAETLKTDEMEQVAGVYINRLRKKMLLQADPTVKFALKDFELRRLLYRHLEVDSPYNTYKYAGLPPGPISMSSIAAIDATLNYRGHDYLYFCARADFSGYHAFAKTFSEHSKNARAYQNELNRRKIK